MENEMNGLTKPRDFGDGCPLTNERYVWSCAIGGLKPVPVPSGGDAPMRRAVERAFLELTGHEAQACFSGWGEEFAEPARAVIENRIPVEEEKSVRADIQSAELATALDQLAAAKAEVERLRDFVVDFADAKIDALRYSPPHGASPEDEPDPVVDAETVWAWQADAKDAIKAAALAQQPPASGDDGRG